MSDSVEDLVKRYNDNVYEKEHPRSIGLFTIPEYPELEAERGMWSAALDAILTTLRYLAPATLLTIFWGQQSFLFKILKHIDSAFRSIVFSSEEQKQAVLKWLADAGPVRVEHLDTVWRHGWILCGVLDAALPGACAGHPPIRLSMKHAQAIADHYLGVEPVFSRQELESNDSLSRHQEWKLATYLDRIRQAISKLTPPVSKPVSQRTSPDNTQCILDYVAKGSGLSAAQINNKAHFKIYPTAQQSLDPGEVTILIRGPKDTYGMAVTRPILGKAQLIRQNILGLQSKQTYTENVLPVTQGAVYLRNYGKNDMNKMYYIPKSQYDIEIEVDPQPGHVKISYTVKLEGKYIISIASRSQNIVGSPFTVTASNNILSILEKDSFSLEDGEEIDIVDVKNDRKVVLRIVDFVTEKMLLKENGILEKISDEEAKTLMTINKEHKMPRIKKETCMATLTKFEQKIEKDNKFKSAAFKILTMYRVCKIFSDVIIKKQLKFEKDKNENCTCSRSQQDVPDIVNSTFNEIHLKPYVVSEKREKFIVPKCISVSLISEKSKTLHDEINEDPNVDTDNPMAIPRPDTPDSLEVENCSPEDECSLFNILLERNITTTGNNPFLNEMFEENYAATNNFGTYVASEYESNNSQHEETNASSIKIIIDPNLTPSPITNLSPSSINKNPFIGADVIDFERPKSPIFKIISGEQVTCDESVFVSPKSELLTEEELSNEFVNPFFTHQFQTSHFDQMPITDFIVGAPVSLPPIIRASTPEPDMKSLVVGENENIEIHQKYINYDLREKCTDVISDSLYSTSNHNRASTPKEQIENNFTTSVHSLDSNLTETTDNSNASTASDNQFGSDRNDSNRNVTPRKDMWDSAYVSIDDSNSSPDSNNNEHTNNHNFSSHDKNVGLNQVEITNIGPAEKEIWQSCEELKNDTNKIQEDLRLYKWEVKRPIFTPIIEESDRSMSSGTKSISITGISPKQDEETNTVSVAFAELNDMYQEYFSDSEISSTAIAEEDNKLHSMEVEYITQTKDNYVDSASEISDVKRHNDKIEGTISEVQANVTESISVSQILHDKQDYSESINKTGVETQFGENKYNNIVLEKKRYWDERIREIEAKAQEVMVPKKRRITSKQLKHDSLSKRKGKQMIKNFLSAGDYSQVTNINPIDEPSKNIITQSTSISSDDEPVISDGKLVTKWKRYWDDKSELDQVSCETDNQRIKVTKNKLPSQFSSPNPKLKEEKQDKEINVNTSEYVTEVNMPIKQELPEEIFKAFETSPKRFFGTSRKQILNKLDIFLGKPDNISIATTDTDKCQDSGLVSSRISLFHNMSNTEELPWLKRKTQSLHNICQRRESEKSGISSQQNSNIEEVENDVQLKVIQKPQEIIETTTINATESSNLKSMDSNIKANLSPKALDGKSGEDSIQLKSINQNEYIRKNIPVDDKYPSSRPKVEALRKKSFSKSEMDIFNKHSTDKINDLDKHKSCDELPKINVKSFISLYENVSKSTDKIQPAKRVYRINSGNSQKICTSSITSDAVPKRSSAVAKTNVSHCDLNCNTPEVTPTNLWNSKILESLSNTSIDNRTTPDVEITPNDNKKRMYLSLSDIELEIIENKSKETSPEREVKPEHIEYKNRFKLAKEYFQSLEEIREPKKFRQLNECELLLHQQSSESLENEKTKQRPQKRVKKNIKSNSLPSCEIAKAWNQFQDRQERCASEENSTTKLVKISEKFNVDDLFTDVTEGKLSRQGSLRGIPHKKAVLEAFRSMENVSDTTLTSYEIVDSHLTNFSTEHRTKNAQRYLSEYPYLPKTDPSQYHSRVDIKASGLISLKELKKKPRRNSVPDLRLNPNFTVDL